MNSTPQPPAAAPTAPANGQPSSGAPAAPRPGGMPAGQNGQPIRIKRRRPAASDPMRPNYRPLKTVARPMVSLTEMNKHVGDARVSGVESGVPVQRLREEALREGRIALPLVMRRGDLKHLRYHIMRLQARGQVDIQDEKQFTQPIRLHRRDPRAPPSGAGAHPEEDETMEDIEESKERDRLDVAREERRKIREENQAKIAPTGTKKPPAFQKKVEQKLRPDDTPEAEKRRLLRYEETLPWHLEDFDNKQTWVGVYESELSESHMMLTTDHDPTPGGLGTHIQMVPLERWYKFQVKNKIAKTTTAEEADEAFKKEMKLPQFIIKREAERIKEEEDQYSWKRMRGTKTAVIGAEDEGAPPPPGVRIKREDDDDKPYIKREADADDIDFNLEEDFADDEEGLNGLFEGDEADIKDATERLKRDQLAASAFDLRNEAEIYRQEEREREEERERRLMEKSMRKTLNKRERAGYDSDKSNPYESSEEEEETDSEAEREKAKEEELRKQAEQEGKVEPGNAASGSSTKGSNTPSGAHRDVNNKKRPGSPNLSEASGTESTRKKHKKKHDKLSKSILNDGTNGRRTAASGSDSEMTDAAKPKKQKLKLRVGGSPSATPGGSRAGSPAPPQLNGSRAASPTGASGAASPPPIGNFSLPTGAEVYNAIPDEGMEIRAMIQMFRNRVNQPSMQPFIRLVKAVCKFDSQRKWLTKLPQLPSEESIRAVVYQQRAPAAAKSAAGSPASPS